MKRTAPLRSKFSEIATPPAVAYLCLVRYYRKENMIPFQLAPSEQPSYVLSGRVRVPARDSQHELGPSDTYAISADIEHSIEIIEDTGRSPRVHTGARRLPLIFV